MSAAALPLLREVRLYGPLRARFGRSHWLAVESPAEAVRALCVLFEGFRDALLGHQGPGYRVLVGEGPRVDVRNEETLALSAGSAGLIRIAPVIHGNKRSGVLGIIAGVALLVVAPYAAGALFGTGTAIGTTAALFVAANYTALAGALIAGGVVQLLSPQRRGSGNQADRETSYQFNGPVNVASPGGPVPLIIGRMIVGSVVVSSGLSTDEYTPPASTLPTSPARPPDEPLDWQSQRESP